MYTETKASSEILEPKDNFSELIPESDAVFENTADPETLEPKKKLELQEHRFDLF